MRRPEQPTCGRGIPDGTGSSSPDGAEPSYTFQVGGRTALQGAVRVAAVTLTGD
jgi:hypothetical protein